MNIKEFLKTAKDYTEMVWERRNDYVHYAFSTITLIETKRGTVFVGVTGVTISFGDIEQVKSDMNAALLMLNDGQARIRRMVTLKFNTRKVVKPSDKVVELLLKLHPDNADAEVITELKGRDECEFVKLSELLPEGVTIEAKAPAAKPAPAAEEKKPAPAAEEKKPEPAPVVEEPKPVSKNTEFNMEEISPIPEPPAEPEPVVEETQPEPVAEPEPVVEETQPEPVAEPEPVVEETQPEPVAEPEPVVEETQPEPVAEPEPVVEETQPEPVAEPEPVVEETQPEPVAEPEPAVEETQPEPVAEPEPAPAPEFDFLSGFDFEDDDTPTSSVTVPLFKKDYSEYDNVRRTGPAEAMNQLANGVTIDESNPFFERSTEAKEAVVTMADAVKTPFDEFDDDDDEEDDKQLTKKEMLKMAKKRKKIAKNNAKFKM